MATQKHLEEAQTFLEIGLPDSALAVFGLAIEENPKLAAAHMGMGEIYRQRCNYRLATASYTTTTHLEPMNFDAHYYLGLSYQLWGEIESAVTTYLRALTLRPQSFDANQHLGSALLQLGRSREAVLYAKRATKLRPDSMAAWANLGTAYRLVGRYKNSVDAYRAANELGQVQTPVLLGMADALIKLRRYPRAINVLKSVVRQESNAMAHERIGYCHWKQREYKLALAQYKSALAIDVDDTAALNGKGVCLMTLYIQSEAKDSKQRDDALNAWRHSVRVNQSQVRIIDLISRYESR